MTFQLNCNYSEINTIYRFFFSQIKFQLQTVVNNVRGFVYICICIIYISICIPMWFVFVAVVEQLWSLACLWQLPPRFPFAAVQFYERSNCCVSIAIKPQPQPSPAPILTTCVPLHLANTSICQPFVFRVHFEPRLFYGQRLLGLLAANMQVPL